ncbi:hypothetical protein PT974_06208 [Cladobotryum mycophilum]|uniref:Uncharacterized protein n=1 Tax=Cladobotryum mycophilum TaxID=491253 RepID=A0ABR0SLM0_9HYPO
MPVVGQLLGEVANIVVRAANDTSASPTTTTGDPTSTSLVSPQASTSTADGGGGKPDNGSSSPLLFFVALGFGVVFTNLWIIVGVKYCFRYNARNRARMTNEDGEPINLENMPRPHRRRREKKLMSMDEVNEKFPMMKYKSWVSQRAREGLPTTGGVGAPASRPNSVRDVDGVVAPVAAKDRSSTEEPSSDTTPRTKPPSAVIETELVEDTEKENKQKKDGDSEPADAGVASDDASTKARNLERVGSEEEEEDDEHIDAALPPSSSIRLAIPAPFALILLKMTTTRRACCPLCKADYYTPKPRPNPEGDGTLQNPTLDPRTNRLNLPSGLPSAWFRSNGSARPTVALLAVPRRQRRGDRDQNPPRIQSDSPAATPEGQTTGETQAPERGMLSSVRHALRFGRRNNDQAASPAAPSNMTEAVTPSQLESGARQQTTPAAS